MAIDVIALCAIIASLGIRFSAMSSAEDGRKDTFRTAFIWSLVGLAGLACYGLTLEPVTNAIGLNEAGAQRWRGIFQSLCPMLWVIGSLPALFLDVILYNNPHLLPRQAAKKASISTLTAALAICLVFPINYMASYSDWEWDTAFFRVSRPGEPTLNAAQTLPEPVNIYLFFPAGNEVSEAIRPYFDQVQSSSNGLVQVQLLDQALSPEIAEEMKKIKFASEVSQ